MPRFAFRLASLGVGLALAGCVSGQAPRDTAAKEIAAVKAASPAPRDCQGLETFFHAELDAYQDAVDKAGAAYQDEQWKVETADPAASLTKMSQRFEAFQKITYDRDIALRVRAAEEATRGVPSKSCAFRDKIQRARALLEAQILTDPDVIKKEKDNQDRQDALITKSNAFRLKVPGEAEPVSKALYQKKLGSIENRAEREKLYREFQSARAKKWIEWGFRDLLKARNEEGRAAGFRNYYDYRFFRNQLDLPNYRAMVREIKEKLAPKVRAFLKSLGEKSGIQKVEGWDIRYLRDKHASGLIDGFLAPLPESAPLEFARRFYTALGFDIDRYGFKMDLYPREGKNTHAFAMSVMFPRVDREKRLLKEPKMDIRFLANLKKPVKWNDASTVIHELAHAIHAAEVRQPLGIFRGTDAVSTEAIAMTVERMANSREFLAAALHEVARVPPEKLLEPLHDKMKAARAEQAFTLLRQVFFSDFEYEMYANPDADLAALWSSMHEDYWGIPIAPEEADWDVEHFVMAPVYVQNYAIGILMVEQLYESIQREFRTSYRSKRLGDKLRTRYFAPGQELDYLQLTEGFTGKPLTAHAALKLLDD